MALENKEVLENLTKQREEAVKQLEQLRATVLKLDGAIDVLSQIEELITPLKKVKLKHLKLKW